LIKKRESVSPRIGGEEPDIERGGSLLNEGCEFGPWTDKENVLHGERPPYVNCASSLKMSVWLAW
jgi:hypothetical protein